MALRPPDFDRLAMVMLLCAIDAVPEQGWRYTWPGVKRPDKLIIRQRDGRYRRAFDGALRP